MMQCPKVCYNMVEWSQLAAEILRRAQMERIEANLILEGGSIHVDGEG